MMSAEKGTCHWKFEAQPEYFFDYVGAAQRQPTLKTSTLPLLGLDYPPTKDQENAADTRKPWPRFASHVERLNEQSPEGVQYKVIYITRHGLGYHNVFEAQVGGYAWNSKWSHLDGDGTIVWADSKLNPQGIEQARALGRLWTTAIADEGMPAPQSIYTSPLARCLETTRLVLQDAVTGPHARAAAEEAAAVPFQPLVKEALRERVTDHTCDRRSGRSWIEAGYPECVVEAGMAEEDPLWTGAHWETAEEHQARKQRLLEDVFDNDPSVFVSLTTHSYAISAILGAVGLKQFRVSEGSSIALLVKGTRIDGSSAHVGK